MPSFHDTDITNPVVSKNIDIKKKWYDCQWDNCPQETKMTLRIFYPMEQILYKALFSKLLLFSVS